MFGSRVGISILHGIYRGDERCLSRLYRRGKGLQTVQSGKFDMLLVGVPADRFGNDVDIYGQNMHVSGQELFAGISCRSLRPQHGIDGWEMRGARPLVFGFFRFPYLKVNRSNSRKLKMRCKAFEGRDSVLFDDVDCPALDIRQAFFDQGRFDMFFLHGEVNINFSNLSVSAPEHVPTPTTVSSMLTVGIEITHSFVLRRAAKE